MNIHSSLLIFMLMKTLQYNSKLRNTYFYKSDYEEKNFAIKQGQQIENFR